jgi:CheY-like chemotaxis protein
LAVTDTGAGMDEATLGHVFEPFFTTKPKGQGTGLGLATVLGIAAQSGGHVFAASAPGQGTAFEVYLPAVDGIPNPERPAARSESESGRGTIVVVEDQAAVRQVVVRALRGHGFKVFEAGDAAEAFALVEQTGVPNLLLSDLVLPNESGLALAKRLRRAHPELPVLFMSADAERILANETPLPASDFIAKPFRPEDLVARVRTLIEGKGARDAAAPGA